MLGTKAQLLQGCSYTLAIRDTAKGEVPNESPRVWRVRIMVQDHLLIRHAQWWILVGSGVEVDEDIGNLQLSDQFTNRQSLNEFRDKNQW